MFRRVVITVALAAILFGVYANHQLIKENEHDIRRVVKIIRDQDTLDGLIIERVDTNQNYIARLMGVCENLAGVANIHTDALVKLNKKLDLSVVKSIGIITNGRGHGSCVAIGEDLILTAGHCLGHEGAWVEINGERYEILEEIKNNKYDVGLVKIDGKVKPLKLGRMPDVLDEIYAIGAPANKAFLPNVSKGVVTKVDFNGWEFENTLIIDASSFFGNSGGPVLNIDGEIVGIVVACVRTDSIGICEPVINIRRALMEYVRP